MYKVLNKADKAELIVVGGSAGSLSVLMQIIRSLPDDFVLPVIIVIHRQKNALSEFTKIVAEGNKNKRIIEPDDKEPIEKSFIYIAPQNYHLLIERDHTFSLDYSEAIKFSRPSIDVTFETAAAVYKKQLVAILLSGANNDGTAGLECVLANAGVAIVQDPSTAEFPEMPRSAIEKIDNVHILDPPGITAFINNLNIK
jgi:two-component system, chemotaxis family, protein-glutamate methylesterase/glutaminase